MTLALVALLAYLLGSIPFGLLITRALGLGDLRSIGSGNIGATNVLRTGNKGAAAATLLLDAAKGAVAVLVARTAAGETAAMAAGLAAFLGHLFPVYLGFAGGKGVATGAGTVLVLMPIPALGALGVWAVVLLLSRLMSLASLTAVVVLSALRLALTTDPWGRDELALTLFALAGSALVVVRHRSNIRRLLAGTEHRLGRSAPPP